MEALSAAVGLKAMHATPSHRVNSRGWFVVHPAAIAVTCLLCATSSGLAQERGFNPRIVISRPFPAIENAPTILAEQADRLLAESELVIGVTVNGQSRAYPINMLTGPQREIINDTLGDRRIAVTWCHLCHNGIVYAARVKDRNLTFVVSGMLWQRNLVMMDLQTRSLWSHTLGRAMRGPLEGEHLEALPSVMTDWRTWRDKFPKTSVLNLSRSSREFHRSVYRDPSLFVVGISVGPVARAWPFDELVRQPVLNDSVNDVPLLVVFLPESHTAMVFNRRSGDRLLTFSRKDGKLVDDQTGSQWDPISGVATDGSLQGAKLIPEFGMVAFRGTWRDFYPHSSYWQPR